MNYSPSCEREPDLISFIYNEASESETRDFELHLKECARCRAEIASFGLVRQSITEWRDEALAGFVATPLPAAIEKRSAIAALRQFFDLSPLWLKGATAFAAVTFCVLVVLALTSRTEQSVVKIDPVKPEAMYSQAEVDRIVKEALARSESVETPIEEKKPINPVNPVNPVNIATSTKPKRVVVKQNTDVKSRRPLTRAEREQLAADLRLLSIDDEPGLSLLGDLINQ